MKKLHQLKSNKGFSLVELLIVIAIMAVLVGVLAPQYFRYVERSRQSADLQVVNSIASTLIRITVDTLFEDDVPTAEGATIVAVWSTNGGGVGAINVTAINPAEPVIGESLNAIEAEVQGIAGATAPVRSSLASEADTIIVIELTDRWRVTHAGHSAWNAPVNTDRTSWDHALRTIRN
ncbi:MAG: prepilin-type N-terminal cleavage/methylation domain-containing protein [Oscillospiraceae bacterium]|jgi:prepilin-type N-terminal cleavage/methylation domain-containing protein|nr:prepilin-type N-terminal cleavage/methylation domain-containing protein [Oscillospiraceae bacterium]